MNEKTPTVERFSDPERPDSTEEFRPADVPDPEEPELVRDQEGTEASDPGEADEADVVEQEAVVDDQEDGYDGQQGVSDR